MAFDPKKLKMETTAKPIAKVKAKGVALPPLKKTKLNPAKLKGL